MHALLQPSMRASAEARAPSAENARLLAALAGTASPSGRVPSLCLFFSPPTPLSPHRPQYTHTQAYPSVHAHKYMRARARIQPHSPANRRNQHALHVCRSSGRHRFSRLSGACMLPTVAVAHGFVLCCSMRFIQHVTPCGKALLRSIHASAVPSANGRDGSRAPPSMCRAAGFGSTSTPPDSAAGGGDREYRCGRARVA